MPALFERLKDAAQRTVAFPMHEPWLDVGRPADLEKARAAQADTAGNAGE
jgi:NDP-sugar pyrophosphorylase family protein